MKKLKLLDLITYLTAEVVTILPLDWRVAAIAIKNEPPPPAETRSRLIQKS